MPANGNVKKFINQERVWLSEARAEINKLFDKYLSRLDEMELRVQKESESEPKHDDPNGTQFGR